jgi:hypothetical protein
MYRNAMRSRGGTVLVVNTEKQITLSESSPRGR